MRIPLSLGNLGQWSGWAANVRNVKVNYENQ